MMKTIRIALAKPSHVDGDVNKVKKRVPVVLSSQSVCCQIDIENPFEEKAEKDLSWYLEDYAALEPFEIGRAKLCVEKLKKYGHLLSKAIVSSGLVPTTGDITLEIELSSTIQASDFSLHSLHWEVLTDTSKWPTGLSLDSVTVNRIFRGPDVSTTDALHEPLLTFNVLIVVCRPGGRNDINHQLVSKPTTQLISWLANEAPFQANIVILRPPTWASFKKHLRDVGHNHYHIVHFDMHGGIVSRDRGGIGATLSFCKPSFADPVRQDPDPRSGEEVAREVAKAGIKNVVLNACESGSTAYNHVNCNLAFTFLENGASFVLAMSHKVLEAAVEVFFKQFYESLLREQLDIVQAAELARHALLRHKARRALFYREIDIEDYINPVVYRQQNAPIYRLPWDVRFDRRQPYDAFAHGIHPDERGMDFLIGRDAHVTELELITTALAQKIVVLSGQLGCGKSAFLQHCEWWWVATKYVERSIYLDLQSGDLSNFGLIQFLSDICKALKLKFTDLDGSEIAAIFRRRRILVVLDGLDREGQSLTDDNRYELQSFIARASQGRSIFIISIRNHEAAAKTRLVDFERVASYRLPNLSVRSAIQLAQRLQYRGTSSSRISLPRGKETLTYLERVMILLDQNPLAIQLVCSPPGALDDPKTLHWSLLSGRGVQLDDETLHSRSCARLRLHLLVLSLKSSKDDSSVFQTVYSPFSIALFWNVMPKDLRYFYYFQIIQFLKPSQNTDYHLNKPLLAFRYTETQDLATGTVENMEYSKYFPELIEILFKMGILENATIRRSDGRVEAAFHISPVATLLLLSYMNESMLSTQTFSFVRFSILETGRYLSEEKYHTTDVIWDNETQHSDHAINSTLSALILSLGGNLSAEIAQHRESLTDALIGPLIQRNWSDSRGAEMGNLIAKIQVLRLVMHMKASSSGPGLTTLLDLSTIANGLVEGGEPDGEGAVRAFFDMMEIWRRKGEKVPPILGTRCFDLLHAEAICVSRKRGPVAAKFYFERNLQTDPDVPLTDSLYPANRRTQLKNLQGWVWGVTELADLKGETNLLNRKMFDEQVPALFASISPGNLVSTIKDYLPALDSVKTTYGQIFRAALDMEEAAVKTFGTLTHQILDQPLVSNFKDVVPEGKISQLFELCSDQGGLFKGVYDDPQKKMTEIFGDLELAFRFEANDLDGVKTLLHRKIAHETSDRATAWRTLGKIHDELHRIAAQQGDWETAKQHLDERWQLHDGNYNTDAEFQANFHMDYAKVMDALNEPVEAGKRIFQAREQSDALESMPLYVHCRHLALELKNLHTFLDQRNPPSNEADAVLSAADIGSLKSMIAEAKKLEAAQQSLKSTLLEVEPILQQAMRMQAALARLEQSK